MAAVAVIFRVTGTVIVGICVLTFFEEFLYFSGLFDSIGETKFDFGLVY
jgi:hypothetical protein